MGAVDRKALQRDMLQWHRRRLTREEVGLPTPRRGRECNHLSQQDLATLTGLSLAVIQRLEQGQSAEEYVLDRVAQALRMYPDQRRTLYELAVGHPPGASVFQTRPDGGLSSCLRMFAGPVLLVDAVFTVLDANALAGRWLFARPEPNLATWLLLDPHAAHVVGDWPRLATRVVNRLREVAARFPREPAVARLLDRVRESPAVDEIWRREPGRFHVPLSDPNSLRRPGHTDPARDGDDPPVPVTVITLHSPLPDDERRVIAFALHTGDEPGPDDQDCGDRGEDCPACPGPRRP